MPRDSIVIEQFRGMAPNADSRDVDLQHASHLLDVDTISKKGELRGRFDDDELNSTAIATKGIELIKDGTEAVIHDNTDIENVTNLDTTPATTSLGTPTSSGLMHIASHGGVVRVACGNGSTHVPQWIGNIEHAQFNGAVGPPSGDIHLRDAPLDALVITTNYAISGAISETNASASNFGVFPKDYYVAYRITFEYDSFQHSPLRALSGVVITSANGASQLDMTLVIVPTSFPERITGVNIWRNMSPTGSSADYPTPWTHVERIDIDDASWTFNTPNYEYAITDIGSTGPTYEDYTGLPNRANDNNNQNDDNLEINYQYNEMINGYHMVAQIYQPTISLTENTDKWLLRSLRNRPDMFRWAEDYLVLPTEINALKAFQGRLYAFAEGITYRIDPERLEIEDVMDGMGVLGDQSIAVSERGMFFANLDNIWWHNGREIIPIGTPVLDNDYDTTLSWHGASHAINPVLTYDGKDDNLIVTFESASGVYHSLVFNLSSASWYIYSHSQTGAPTVGFTQLTGDPVVVFGGIYTHIGGATTRKGWTWTSKEINYGTDAIVPYTAYIEGNGNTFNFWENEDNNISYYLLSNANYDGFAHRLRVNSQVRGVDAATSWGRYGKVKMQLIGDSDHTVNVISLEARRVRLPSGSGDITTSQLYTPNAVAYYYATVDDYFYATITGSPVYASTMIDSVTAGRYIASFRFDEDAGYGYGLEILSTGDGDDRYIRKFTLDLVTDTDIISQTGSPTHVIAAFVLARFSQKMYVVNVKWATNGYQILEYDLDGNLLNTLFDGTTHAANAYARGIAISPDEKYLFWRSINASMGSDDKFYRYELSTGTATDIQNITASPASVYDRYHDEYCVDSLATGDGLFLNVDTTEFTMPYPDGGAENNLSLSTVGRIMAIDRGRQNIIMYSDGTGPTYALSKYDYDGGNATEVVNESAGIVTVDTGYN